MFIQHHNLSYEATVASSTNDGEPFKLGSLIYRGDSQSLALVNHNTALQRKVLLLGYSKKSSHHDIIGQFGRCHPMNNRYGTTALHIHKILAEVVRAYMYLGTVYVNNHSTLRAQ